MTIRLICSKFNDGAQRINRKHRIDKSRQSINDDHSFDCLFSFRCCCCIHHTHTHSDSLHCSSGLESSYMCFLMADLHFHTMLYSIICSTGLVSPISYPSSFCMYEKTASRHNCEKNGESICHKYCVYIDHFIIIIDHRL